jgi:hypothetical protein
MTARPKTRQDAVIVADLNVDPTIQRRLVAARVKKLVAEWDENKAGSLIVSERADGSLWLLDGQHRAAAGLKVNPELMLYAVIYTGLTLDQEANIFLAHNQDSKRTSWFDNYHAGLIAKKDWAIRIDKAARDHGLEVAGSASAHKIAAIAKMKDLVEMDPGDTGLLSETLDVCLIAWGRQAKSWDNTMLLAIGLVINRNRAKIDLIRLGEQLRFKDVDHWKQMVPDQVGGAGSKSRSNKLTAILVDAYNKRLGAERRIH